MASPEPENSGPARVLYQLHPPEQSAEQPPKVDSDSAPFPVVVLRWIKAHFGPTAALLVAIIAIALYLTFTFKIPLTEAPKLAIPPAAITPERIQAAPVNDWKEVAFGVGSKSTIQPHEVGINATGALTQDSSIVGCWLAVAYAEFISPDGGYAPTETRFKVRTYGDEVSRLDVFLNPAVASRLGVKKGQAKRMFVRLDCASKGQPMFRPAN